MADSMRNLITTILEALVDNPDGIKISEVEGDSTRIVEVQVDREDVGKIIGKQGRTADAIRTIISAASGKSKKKTSFHIIDNQDRDRY
jgi:predicted RNA-binding protein YlqC (UPF0109 family)